MQCLKMTVLIGIDLIKKQTYILLEAWFISEGKKKKKEEIIVTKPNKKPFKGNQSKIFCSDW